MTASISTHIDYLQGTGNVKNFEALETFLNKISDFLALGDHWHLKNHGFFCGRRWDISFKSIRGKFHGGFSQTKDKNLKYLIYLPGTYFEQSAKEYEILQFLETQVFNVTRIDIALDDFKRRADFQKVKRAGENGNYRLVQSYKCIESTPGFGIRPIPTCYFGSSDKILRFYNAHLLHENNADRWELQLRDDHARVVFSDYLEDPTVLSSFVTGAVDFGIKVKGKFRRCHWWQSLRREIGNQKIRLPQFNPSFEKAEKWLFDQVAPTLAVALRGYGQKRFEQLIKQLTDNGAERFSEYHHQWIKEIQKEIS